jgi:hypothetical protein
MWLLFLKLGIFAGVGASLFAGFFTALHALGGNVLLATGHAAMTGIFAFGTWQTWRDLSIEGGR